MSTAPNLVASPPPPPPAPLPFPAPHMADDYGPAGTPPTTSAAIWFEQKKSSKAMPSIVIGIGAVTVLIGILVMVAATGGWIVILVGIFFLVFGYILRKNQVNADVVCDDRGLNIRRTSRKEGILPPIRIPWQTVTGMRCWVVTTETSTGENGRTTRDDTHFAIDSTSQPLSQWAEYDLKGFADFITHCSAHTPHLPYQWLPKKTAKALPILEHAGHFVKVPR